MRIVAISPFLTYPGVDHAGGEFLLHHLEHLGTDNQVALFGLSWAGAESDTSCLPGAAHLMGLLRVPRAQTVRRRAQRGCIRAYPGLAALRWGTLGAPREELEAMLAPAAEHLRSADVIELHWAERILAVLGAVKRVAPDVPVVLVLYDLPWQADARRRSLDRRSWLKQRAFGLSLEMFRRWELGRMAGSDAALVFKDQDRRHLAQAGLDQPMLVIDPPLQAPSAEPSRARASRREGRNVLMTGAFDRPENYRSALWFLDQVWPSVEARCPHARCIIAGTHPPELLQARAAGNVIVTGYVPSLAPLYEDADVFVAPLLAGAGLKFKVPQAMLYGLPVVATPIAVEGVVEEAGPGAFAAITVEPTAMAQSVVDLLTHPERARVIAERARRWAAARYDFAASTGRVLAMYEEITRASTAH